jgi:hydrogenase maturation protein HypF
LSYKSIKVSDLSEDCGTIRVRGIVQGVGFRPYVYASAVALNIRGTVKNIGSEVEILAIGDHFDQFVNAIRHGPPRAVIDSVTVTPLIGPASFNNFSILTSSEGARSGMIPPDIAICDECLVDITNPASRYYRYWATSCVNCGPRYSILDQLPYDRQRTTMDAFPVCEDCKAEYSDPASRRHHAQTIACPTCGPGVRLYDRNGDEIGAEDPIDEAASRLAAGEVVALKGIGGFHIACTEATAPLLKERLGRTEQPFAVMVTPARADLIAQISEGEQQALSGIEHPIVVLMKRERDALKGISNLHTIGCMLPYTGLHHLLFSALADHATDLLVMTSANMPGYPMITDLSEAVTHLSGVADCFLSHDRRIVNRCDDSVIRDGYLIRLSRGYAPLRTRIPLGDRCILGVGAELNVNATIYRDGFAVTSPHIGNVRNPKTLQYLDQTVETLGGLLGAEYDLIVHDLHPRFLSTRFAERLGDELGAEVIAVQHHRAHIAAATQEPCVGIAIDGVGYGDDRTIWGGEIFAGETLHMDRVGHLEAVPMPGGDLATRFPERMLYGLLPDETVLDLLDERGWSKVERRAMQQQVAKKINTPLTSSTGRVLDAMAALLGICRERTYDGEPAMVLESVAAEGTPHPWDLEYRTEDGAEVLSTRALVRKAFNEYRSLDRPGTRRGQQQRADLAASIQFNLARGIAGMAVRAADEQGLSVVTLSGGVAINAMIRETIRTTVCEHGLTFRMNDRYPPGDGCVSFGQVVYGGKKSMD